jgi:hypothetical protein
MRKMLFVAILVATSCSTAPASPPLGDDAGYVCRAGTTDRFIGQAATAELGVRMLAASGARQLRWVPYGGMITMDYSPSRLTVRLDQQNRVESASCG